MAERPWSNLARINSRCASQTLRQARRGCRAQNSATTGGRPLAGTGICPSDPVGASVAGFEPRSGLSPAPNGPESSGRGVSDPVGALAGFASANRTYRETVPRSMCSSRAIRRNDQRCACSCNTACTIAILRRFDIPGLLPHEVCKEGPTSNLAPLNMAAFQALNAGGFLAPNDTCCTQRPACRCNKIFPTPLAKPVLAVSIRVKDGTLPDACRCRSQRNACSQDRWKTP